jgi:hypothetical protein
MFRWLFSLIAISLIGLGIYYGYESPNWTNTIQDILPSHDLSALEVKFTPEQLIQKYQSRTSEKGLSYDEMQLELYPYLLMDVKYVKGANSYEGKLLWSLNNGEIVLNTRGWQISHGYDDCLMAHATKDEMKVINALAIHSGQLDRQRLLDYLKHESTQVDLWLEKCYRKQLITQNGNYWKLHIQEPIFCSEPITIIKEPLVQRPLSEAKIITGRYRSSQVMDLAKASFGSDFAIKRYQEVFLPVYSLTFKNGDGSKSILKLNAYSASIF